jgi:preprotein translocase subunit SecB
MADKQNQNPAASADLPVNILAQYVKDASFENPQAPGTLRPSGKAPEMEVNIGMDARKLDDPQIKNCFEVALKICAKAKRDNDIMFVLEVEYAAAVAIDPSVPEGGHHPILLIEVPRIMFPYAREFISMLTVHGGYPPLLLNPVDFQALYMNRFGDEIAAAQKKA